MSDSYVTEILVARRRARRLVAVVAVAAAAAVSVSLYSLVVDALAAHAELVRTLASGTGR
ncbi:hypothetical protein [Aromatoleum anaerobium]|uniref:Uncharacterized protein n=1 Tax=Aromatoleum anaerobium TaxID=182180 RepID=A0ABX1PQX0_9RHOO|nr:hypothetical protein [Aromatoleum anaerobium]MCK0507952.1 hypothetical protein [Aromatoleum anaerobium]